MSAGGSVVELLSTSMRDLAVELDVSYATVRAWAAGTRQPSRENRRKLAAFARRRGLELLGLAGELEERAVFEARTSADELIAEHRALRRENRALIAAVRRGARSIRRP